MADNEKNQQQQGILVLLVSLRFFRIGLTVLGEELLGHTVHGVQHEFPFLRMAYLEFPDEMLCIHIFIGNLRVEQYVG